jgi:hypothetical protein
MRYLSSTVSNWVRQENPSAGPLKLVLLAVCLAASVEASAQSRVEGVVLFGATDQPISGAEVDLWLDGPEKQNLRYVLSDQEGRFAFADVPAGRHMISAKKADYFAHTRSERLVDQQSPIFSTWITVTAAEPLTGVVLQLVRGSAITGRVFDTQGEPAAGMGVMASRYVYDDNGARVIQISESMITFTTQTGEFWIRGLRRGEYLISLVPPPAAAKPDSTGIAPLTTYYPATEDPLKTVPLDVQAGRDYTLDDIRMLSGKLASVRLRIVDSTGEPKPAGRELKWALSSGAVSSAGGITAVLYGRVLALAPGITYLTPVSPNDDVLIPNLPPGTYEFTVGWQTSTGSVSGHTTVEVRDLDVERDLEVRPNRRVTGRVILEDDDRPPEPLPNIDTNLLSGPVMPSNAMYRTLSQSDGTFVIDSVPEGTYPVWFRDLPPDAYVASAVEGVHDILTQPLRVTGETALAVFVRRDGGTVEGLVTDSRGRKLPDAVVALVPDGLAREEVNRYRKVTTDPNGAFTIQGITPGSYHLFAWSELDGAAYRNAQFIGRYEGKGEPVHLGRGDRLTVQLKLADN